MKAHGLVYFQIDHVGSLGTTDPSVSPPFSSGHRITMCHTVCQAKFKIASLGMNVLDTGHPSYDAMAEVGPCSKKTSSPLSCAVLNRVLGHTERRCIHSHRVSTD